jgi:DNA-binding XRE family transcriptional regulator
LTIIKLSNIIRDKEVIASMTASKRRQLFATCRKAEGTQAVVANEMQISTVYLRMIENGTFTPGRDLMFRFSKHFKQPVEELFPDYFKGSVSHAQSDN